MPANLLADKIISELKNGIGTDGSKFDSSTPSKANKAIAKAITDYLIENTQISVAYAGIIPGSPPVPDPIAADVFKITGNCSPASSTSFDGWLIELTLNIQKGFQFDSGNLGLRPAAPTLCFMGPVPFTGTQSNLNLANIHENTDSNDPQKAVWTAISNSILTWLNSQTPPPFACVNSSAGSSGVATVVKITVI